MRVAYIVSMFPCWSETFILREILELRRRGVELTVFSLKPCTEQLVHPEAEKLVREGIVVYPSPWRGTARVLRCALAHPWRVARFLRDALNAFRGSPGSFVRSLATAVLAADCLPRLQACGIRHLHAPWGTYPSTAALFLARIAGYPFSFTTHAHDLFLEDHALALKFRECRFAQTISDYNRAVIGQRHPDIDLAKVHVIHCGLVPEEFAGPQTLQMPPLMLSIGRLGPIKGFPDLIDACAILQTQGVAFRCRIVGDGPMREELRERINRQGLSGIVELIGAKPQGEIKHLLKQATCVVLPCVTTPDGDQDGIPTVLMEAMAAGVPVISCPTSGVPELVEHEVTGLLAEQRNSQALAQAIERLLSDPDLRARLASAGCVKVDAEFNIGRTAFQLATLFKEGSNNPRRIMLIVDELEVGGAQRQILELAKGLAACGFSVQAVYFRAESAAMLPDFQAAGIPCSLVPKRRRVDLPFLFLLRRAMVTARPDIVQTFTPTADLWGRSAAVLAGVPVIISSARDVRMHWTMRLLDPFTTIFTANSQAVKDSLIGNRGVAEGKTAVIPNGIDLSRYRVQTRATGANGRPVIGTVCRLDPVKNLSCLLKATALLLKSGVERRVEIAGDGPILGTLRDEARALGVEEAVVFLGEQRDVPSLFCRWDIAVLPSWSEGCSNFLMEAMASGMPIVASDIPGNRELLDNGQAGMLFPSDDHASLANTLNCLITDRSMAEILAKRARETAEGLSVKAMVDKHLLLYGELTKTLKDRF